MISPPVVPDLIPSQLQSARRLSLPQRTGVISVSRTLTTIPRIVGSTNPLEREYYSPAGGFVFGLYSAVFHADTVGDRLSSGIKTFDAILFLQRIMGVYRTIQQRQQIGLRDHAVFIHLYALEAQRISHRRILQRQRGKSSQLIRALIDELDGIIRLALFIQPSRKHQLHADGRIEMKNNTPI